MTEDSKSKQRQDEELDEALEESFPASDPPAPPSSDTGVGAPDHKRQEKQDEDRRPVRPGPLRPGSGGMPVRDQ